MKFFYLGMQRSGTKSFGDFFRKNGYRVFTWIQLKERGIAKLYWDGKWCDILSSGIFDEFDVFEDGPFWHPRFARFLGNYVDESRFVYFHRPPDDWYKSMCTYAKGVTFGDVTSHAYLYDRLDDLEFIRSNIQNSADLCSLPMIGMREHYVRLYRRHSLEISALFKDFYSGRFFSSSLYDQYKFDNMAKWFGIQMRDTSEQISHKTAVSFAEVVSSHKCLFRER